MPFQIVFLDSSESLAHQVATVIIQERSTLPIDLGDTQVWVPTTGALRRIRAGLAKVAAELGTGVLSPKFSQPMEALLQGNDQVASRAEREAAWAGVFKKTSSEDWDQLLPAGAILSNAAGALGVGGMLCDLCDLLAEGGLEPTHPLLGKICEDDLPRWEQLRVLYPLYLDHFQREGRHEPNALRLESLSRPTPPAGIRRIVVACIPDLPEVAVRYLEGVAKTGVSVQILVWKPGALPGGWDSAGRPLPSEWNAGPLGIDASQIAVERETQDETKRVLHFLAAAPNPGDYALILADETLGSNFAAEIENRKGVAFQPKGRMLAQEEAGLIALQWETWQSNGDLRILRGLLQLPHFMSWIGSRARLHPVQLLAACDFLIVDVLAENLSQARAFLDGEPIDPTQTEAARLLLAALDSVRNVSFLQVIEEAWERTTEEAEGARRVLELWKEMEASPFYRDWPEGRSAAFARVLRSEPLFGASPAESVELSGWLEAPWLEVGRLAICGCIEGRLPTSVNEHPFLPDSKRAALGLQDNSRRLARDAYLLSCLLKRYDLDNLLLSHSRFDAEGSPTLPSRLLLRTAPEALPDRVERLFQTPVSRDTQPQRKNQWRWHLPERFQKPAKLSISPSRCASYLACPTRYYWKNILHAEATETDPREMEARTFGSLLHRTLELFARRAPDESNATRIEKVVLEEFALEALRRFGPSPTAAVRVQLEAGKVRLRAFARVQAEEYANGWRIKEVEKRIAPDGESPIMIGPLALSAQVDRIEEHPQFGLRIMDYKTSAEPKDPAKIHFGKANPDHFLPEANVIHSGKERSWTDLQLPLYRRIGELLYGTSSIQTCYFALPADPSETKVIPLELDSESYESALICAAEIARRIASGIFWPPQLPKYDDYGTLFLNGPPEDCFSEKTIAFLKGTP